MIHPGWFHHIMRTTEITESLRAHLGSLAEHFGISWDRICYFSSADDLKNQCIKFGALPDEMAGVHEGVRSYRLQVDDKPRGPEVRIFIQDPMPTSVHHDSSQRLRNRGRKNIGIELGDTRRPGFLLTFLLLHEIAHHQLRHVDDSEDQDLYARQEREADLWAAERVRRFAPD